MLSFKRFAVGLVFGGALLPFGAAATLVSPPVYDSRDRNYSDIEICTGKVEGASRTQRVDACSDIIDGARLLGKSLGAIYEARAFVRQSRNDLKSAIADYDQAVLLNPTRSETLINRGSAHLTNGEQDQAVADYTKAISMKPNNFWARYNRGVIYSFKKKDYRAALADLNAAIKLDNSYAPAFSARGMVNNRLGSFRAAIADHDEAVRLKPASATTYEMRAATYLSRKDYEHAIADYARAHELAPNRALALFGLGVAEFRSGMVEKGQAEMAAAKKMKPDIDQDFEDGGIAE